MRSKGGGAVVWCGPLMLLYSVLTDDYTPLKTLHSLSIFSSFFLATMSLNFHFSLILFY